MSVEQADKWARWLGDCSSWLYSIADALQILQATHGLRDKVLYHANLMAQIQIEIKDASRKAHV